MSAEEAKLFRKMLADWCDGDKNGFPTHVQRNKRGRTRHYFDNILLILYLQPTQRNELVHQVCQHGFYSSDNEHRRLSSISIQEGRFIADEKLKWGVGISKSFHHEIIGYASSKYIF
jgi:hypothetical protein